MRVTVKDNNKLLVALAAQSYAAGANNGAAINCSQVTSVSFHLNAGTFGASATLDAKLQYTDVADGSSGWTDAGIAMAQLLAAGGAQSAQLDVLDVAHLWYRVLTTVAVAAVVHSVTAVQGGGRHRPAGQALV
jgi:hypothetical protein